MENPVLVTFSPLIDWISVTYPPDMFTWSNSADGRVWAVDPRHISLDRSPWHRRVAILGYRWAVISAHGTICLWNERESGMGIHLIYSGSALKHLNPFAIIKQALERAKKITRLDLSVDVPWELPLEQMKHDFADGRAMSGAKSYELRQSTTGSTLYIGSRTSGRYLRVYDKAAQQELPIRWYRVELECKEEWAKWAAEYVVKHGFECIPAFIKQFCHWPNIEAWCQVINTPCPNSSNTSDRVMPNPERWLLDQVAPNLARVIAVHPDFLSEFLGEVAKKGQKYGKD